MDRVLDTIHQETGLYLDRCNTAGGKGGTSTNGPQGRRFFSEEVIDTVEKLADSKHKDNLLLLLHRQLSTILSVVSSSRKVELEEFKDLCDSTTFHSCDNFPWVKINHAFWFHLIPLDHTLLISPQPSSYLHPNGNSSDFRILGP